MLIDYAKTKRGLAYSMHRESLGEKRIKTSKSTASSGKETLSLNSQAISLQQRYPLLNQDLDENKKIESKPQKMIAPFPPPKSTPIKDIIDEGEQVTVSRKGANNSQGSLINSKNQTPAASNQLIPTGIFSNSLPPSRVQITHSRKVIHQTLHLPNLDKNQNPASINRTASGSAANRTFSGPMYHPGESMVKYLRQFDSPNQLTQRGNNTSDSPLPRFAGSYYINQLNAQRLNKVVPVAKATTLHRRFNSTLNSYLSAPITDKNEAKNINVQEDPKQEEIPSESYSPQRDDVDIIDSRLQSKANLTERKKKRPQSSFDLCTLRAKFNKNFVQSESMTKKIKTGIITKPMLAPIPFKFGQKFKNKSEEERYLRNCTQFLKLRTLLVNDPSNARDTLMSFLMRFLEREIIEKFTDLHVQRLVKTVLEFKSFDPCVSMTQIIKAVMNEKYDLVGLKFTEFNTKEEEILRVLGIGSNTARQYSQMQEKLKRVEMPPTTHQCLKQQGVSFPRLMETGDHMKLDRMINKVIEKQKKIRVGEHPKPFKMTSPRELRPPIAIEVEEFSQEIKGILKEKKEIDVMKRNKLLLEHVIVRGGQKNQRERVKQKTIESGMQLED